MERLVEQVMDTKMFCLFWQNDWFQAGRRL